MHAAQGVEQFSARETHAKREGVVESLPRNYPASGSPPRTLSVPHGVVANALGAHWESRQRDLAMKPVSYLQEGIKEA